MAYDPNTGFAEPTAKIDSLEDVNKWIKKFEEISQYEAGLHTTLSKIPGFGKVFPFVTSQFARIVSSLKSLTKGAPNNIDSSNPAWSKFLKDAPGVLGGYKKKADVDSSTVTKARKRLTSDDDSLEKQETKFNEAEQLTANKYFESWFTKSEKTLSDLEKGNKDKVRSAFALRGTLALADYKITRAKNIAKLITSYVGKVQTEKKALEDFISRKEKLDGDKVAAFNEMKKQLEGVNTKLKAASEQSEESN